MNEGKPAGDDRSHRMMKIRTRKLGYALGAEILDIDLTRPLDPGIFAEIYQCWLDHLVVVIPGQHALTPEQHLAFSRRFGEVDHNESSPSYRLKGYTEVIELTNRPTADGKPSPSRDVGRKWHSDLDFTLRPTKASLLWCGQLPEVGGDTMFANMIAAYETLSSGLKKTLEGLHAVYDVAAGLRQEDHRDPAIVNELTSLSRAVAQPVVRVHPETGRKALFISERAVRFEGWTDAESQPLMRYLCAHATRPELTWRKQWRTGDLLIWDNRSTIHLALADYDRSQIRTMRRTAIQGTPSGHVVDAQGDHA